ncbi:MAG: family N-acetyltransferase [Sphaerisporangium sp.]|nr:family N-acetyltransferase [Sphaerisporangium sp.]
MTRTQVAIPKISAPAAVPAVQIRPARMDDEQRVRALVEGLSLSSQTLRFFTGLTRPDKRLVGALIARDDRRDVLLAVDGDERVLGHAMSFRRPDATEIAVMVADEWQGLGLGSRLVRALLRRAVARGAVSVGMDVMGENRKVLSIVKRWWPDAEVRVESGTVEILARIGTFQADRVLKT